MAEGYFNYRNAWIFEGPPHKESLLQKKEWRALLKQGGFFVRNTYDFDCPTETSFWNLIKDRFGDMEELSGNTRKKIRRSLEKLEFRQIEIELLKKSGYAILKSALDDYAITDRVTNVQSFNSYLNFCEQKHYEYWGVFDRQDKTFVGFCLNHVWDDACEYSMSAVIPEYKRKSTTYPYYGLFYSMNRYYLKEKGLRYVTDGTRSITEHSNIQPFLEEKFHFRKSYCHLAVHYQWWMKIAVKILYPFRKIITIPQVKAVLNMESMTR